MGDDLDEAGRVSRFIGPAGSICYQFNGSTISTRRRTETQFNSSDAFEIAWVLIFEANRRGCLDLDRFAASIREAALSFPPGPVRFNDSGGVSPV